MPAALRRLVAACLFLGSLALPATAPVASAQPAADPLEVSITSLSPSALTSATQQGRLVIRGEVLNSTQQKWSQLTAYLAPGATPLHTEDELSNAISEGLSAPTGSRLSGAGQSVQLPDLPPGASASFRLSLPIRSLGLTPGAGVHQVVVQVLGSGPQGIDDQPDGIARTFLPVMPKRAAPAEVSIVVPFRAAVARSADGSLLDAPKWSALIADSGRLDNVLWFCIEANLPVTVLADPSVIDAIDSLSIGNPARGAESRPGSDPAATTWLQEFQTVADGSRVLSLPYGDLDVAAAVDLGETDLLGQAQSVSASSFAGFSSVDVIAPSSGTLTPAELRALPGGSLVLLGVHALSNPPASMVETKSGVSVTVPDQDVAAAAPGGADLLALRQAILARLAVRSLSGAGVTPVVVTFPSDWQAPDRTASQDFFSGLALPWVVGADLPVVSPSAPVVPYSHFNTPTTAPAAVPFTNFVAAKSLASKGQSLAELLGTPDLKSSMVRQALLAVSGHVAARPKAAASRTNDAALAAAMQLNKVTLSGPTFVTLSSGTGSFQVTITNGLDQDVTVGLDAAVGSPELTVRSVDPIQVAAGQQRSVRVTVTSHHLGVYRVTLHAVTTEGTELPGTLVLSVRGSQVGQIIWVIMGVAAGIVFFTIGMRTARRIRGRRG